MKISPTTIAILKNLASINGSILIRSGNKLSTISPAKNIFCSTTISETFPTQFAIYDLNQFLGAASLFEEPEFDFQDKFVRIFSGKKSIRYLYADESMITSPSKEMKMPAIDVEFMISDKQLAEIQKAAGVLQAPDICVVGDGNTVSLVACDSKNSSAPAYSVDLGITTDNNYNLVFKAENLKLMSGDYNIQVSSKGIGRFFNDKLNIEYFIAVETHSTFAK